MSVVIKSRQLKFRNTGGEEYYGVNAVSEEKTTDVLQQIEQKGQDVLDSIPNTYIQIDNKVDLLNDNVDRLNEGGLILKDDVIAENVQDWLDEHPEATTTVLDGALTYKKLYRGTLGFVIPEMFGAVGDSVTDDTAALQSALQSGLPVYGLKGKTYYATNTITNCKSSIHNISIILDVNKAISYNRVSDIVIENSNFTQKGTLTDPDDRGTYAFGFSFCSNITFDNCVFENFNGSIILNVTKDSSITNCKFDTAIQTATGGNGYGVVLQCCKNIVIANNVFKDIARHAIYISYSDAYEDDPSFSGFTKYCTDITVQNNIFKLENLITGYNATTFEYQVKTISAKNVLISDNSFSGCLNAIWLSQSDGFSNSNIIIQGNSINKCIGARACILALSITGDVINDNIIIDSNIINSDNPGIKLFLTENLSVTNNLYNGSSYLLFLRHESNIIEEDTLYLNNVKISNNNCKGGIVRFVGAETEPLGFITNCRIENNSSSADNALFFSGSYMKFQYLYITGNTMSSANNLTIYGGNNSSFDRVYILNNILLGSVNLNNSNSNLIYVLGNKITTLTGDYISQLITDHFDSFIVAAGTGTLTPVKGYNNYAVSFPRTLRDVPNEVILIPMASSYFGNYVDTFIVRNGSITKQGFEIAYNYISDTIVSINFRYIVIGQH